MTVLAHRLADRGDEVYETPEVAVEALLSVEQIRVCGSRLVAPAPSCVLRAHGYVWSRGTSSTTNCRIKTAVLHLASRFEDFVSTKVAVTTAILLAGGLTARQALSGSL